MLILSCCSSDVFGILHIHSVLLTGKRDYPCPVCKRAFNHVGSMNRHAKEQHNFDTSTGKYCEYSKIPKNSDTRKIAVIVLKFKQCGSTIESCLIHLNKNKLYFDTHCAFYFHTQRKKVNNCSHLYSFLNCPFFRDNGQFCNGKHNRAPSSEFVSSSIP